MAARKKKAAKTVPTRKLSSQHAKGTPPPTARERVDAEEVIKGLKAVDGKIIKEVVKRRVTMNGAKLAAELVEELIDIALNADRAFDRRGAISELFRYLEPPPPQEKAKPPETLPPEKVRKSVRITATAQEIADLDPNSPAFEAVRKMIDLGGKADEEEE